MNTQIKLKKMIILSLMTTIALIIFIIESNFPAIAPIPGIKLGLANIITLFLLQHFSKKDAFAVLMMRIILGSMFAGQAVSFTYSIAGGLLCFAIMCFSSYLFQKKHLVITSILGSIFHNLGQILAALYIFKNPSVLLYLPYLMISAIITGLFTGLTAHFTSIHFNKIKSSIGF